MPQISPSNFADRMIRGMQQRQQQDSNDQLMQLRQLAEGRTQAQHDASMAQQQRQMQQQNYNDEAQALRVLHSANKALMQVPYEQRSQWLQQAKQRSPVVARALEQIPEDQLQGEGLSDQSLMQFDQVLSASIPQVNKMSPDQFGSTEIVKDEQGNMFFATQARNPGTGQVSTRYSAISGNAEAPQGRVEIAKKGMTSGEQVDFAAELTRAKEEAKHKALAQIEQTKQSAKIDDADEIYKNLSSADLDLIYGRGEKWYPEFFRSQKGIDLIAQRDKLVNMLTLAARGELKGQGQITEGEQKMLRQAVTTLENPNISPNMAKKAIDRAMTVLYRNAGQEFTPDNEGVQVINWEDM